MSLSLGSLISYQEKLKEMRHPSYLRVTSNSSTIGIAIICLEMQKGFQKRIYILHLSANDIKDYQTVLKEVCDYIWLQYPCVEIRTGIFPQTNEEGKFVLD